MIIAINGTINLLMDENEGKIDLANRMKFIIVAL
jgi:hypothetical protein